MNRSDLAPRQRQGRTLPAMTPTMTLTTEVLHRAAYLRRSKNDVRNRRKLQPYQQEQYELFNSTYCRFKLTDSALWQQVIADAATHPRTIGLTSPDAGCARRSESAARSPGADRSARSRLEGLGVAAASPLSPLQQPASALRLRRTALSSGRQPSSAGRARWHQCCRLLRLRRRRPDRALPCPG